MQENHKTDLILFDLDGTLIDTAPDFHTSLNTMLKKYNMNEVTRLCKSILMMKDGIIIDEGNPEELINKHGRKNLEEVFLKLSRSKNELN